MVSTSRMPVGHELVYQAIVTILRRINDIYSNTIAFLVYSVAKLSPLAAILLVDKWEIEGTHALKLLRVIKLTVNAWYWLKTQLGYPVYNLKAMQP